MNMSSSGSRIGPRATSSPRCRPGDLPRPRQQARRLARDRIRKCEGRKSHAEERPAVVDLVKRLHKQGMSYRAIGAELERAGHVNERGRPFHHKSVRAMLDT